MNTEQVVLRCEDKQEAVVFSKYTYKSIMNLTDGQVKLNDGYEIMVEDSYVGGEYAGFFGRIRRAWRAFFAKPVVYTGIYCEDKEKMRKFLSDCLSLIEENDVEKIKTMYDEMKGNVKEPFLNGLYED